MQSHLARRLKHHEGYSAIQAIYGVGPIMASIFVAEIGDASRFPSARHLCSWAGITPTHRESDVKVRRGHITAKGTPSCAGQRSRRSPAITVGRRSSPPIQRIAKRRRHHDRPRRRGAKAPQPRLLRPSRTVRSAVLQGRRAERFGHSHGASSAIDVAPPLGRGRRTE